MAIQKSYPHHAVGANVAGQIASVIAGAPATAIAILEAEKLAIDNFYIISMHKIVEPVMRALLEDKELSIDGFICPGHVAVIIGEDGFNFLEKYNSIWLWS